MSYKKNRFNTKEQHEKKIEPTHRQRLRIKQQTEKLGEETISYILNKYFNGVNVKEVDKNQAQFIIEKLNKYMSDKNVLDISKL